MGLIILLAVMMLFWLMVETNWLRVRLPDGRIKQGYSLELAQRKQMQLKEVIMSDRRTAELPSWQQEMISDVVARIPSTGALLSLPRRVTAEGVMRIALAGVFARVGELMEAYELAIANVQEVATDSSPTLETRGKDAIPVFRDEHIIRDEQGWLDYFKDCLVLVHDTVVGRKILKDALESMEGYRALIKSMVDYQDVAVPLLEYPGVRLFGGGNDEDDKGSESVVPEAVEKGSKKVVAKKAVETGEEARGDDWE